MNKTKGQKRSEISKLSQGDIIELTNSETCEFVRLKRTRFIGKIDGKGYDVPVSMFKKIIETSENKIDDIIDNLEYEDLFYYQSNSGRAVLLQFEKMKDERIVGINPISKGTVRIDREMFVDKVANLQN